jgi:hypothetical protein
VNWVTDMTARWVRIMSVAGDGSTPLDGAVHEISAIGGTPGRKGWFGRLKGNGPGSGEASAVTSLSRQLVAGVLVSDLMMDRLCVLTRQTREQLLEELTFGMPGRLRDQQLRALQAELSGSCALLRDPERATYVTLGLRIEGLLRLAEEQASAIIGEARAEAARITSSAGERQPCPRCEAS